MKGKRGFTLVEMMTVIVIIGLLAFITMKLMVYVNHKMGKARTAAAIERINHALSEFYAIYGIYPPVSGTRWWGLVGPPVAPPEGGYKLNDGMANYLFNDPKKEKWAHYLEKLEEKDTAYILGTAEGYGMVEWTNTMITMKDAWGEDYVYETDEPFQRYRLYSSGPDKKRGTADDVGNKYLE